MQPGQAELEQLKQGMRAMWMAGDFGQIAQYSRKAADDFIPRVAIKAGDRVLDIACGTGNLAIPAARLGAEVTGVDIASNLLEQARKRAASEGVKVRFDEGDAEQLSYADGQFDIVMSMFGAMFAPRPERVAAEMVRVCRPGGRIAMANWTTQGFTGKTFSLVLVSFPRPKEFLLPPVGRRKTRRKRTPGKRYFGGQDHSPKHRHGVPVPAEGTCSSSGTTSVQFE